MSSKTAQGNLSLAMKLSEIRNRLGAIPATAYNDFHRFWYRSADSVLIAVKSLIDEYKLILVPLVTATKVSPHTTKDGKSAYFTEIWTTYRWLDTESGETLDVPWYAQGLDDAEKGVGKAYTYSEKYFFLKFFNVSTSEDDPDKPPQKREFSNKQKDFDFLKAIQDLKPLIEETEYYKYLAMFKKQDGAPADHSNEIQPKHRENLYKMLKEIVARNERFVNILQEKGQKIAKDAMEEILLRHTEATTFLDMKNRPTIKSLATQKAIIKDIGKLESSSGPKEGGKK